MKKSFVYLAGAVAATMCCPVAAQAAPETIDALAIVQQSAVVKGHVTDTNGEPIVGASVVEKGTRNATMTDGQGRFTLKVKAGATISISYVGYRAQELAAKATMNVVMEENTEALGEVVVLGYGAQARKQDLSASVGVINNADELAARPVSSTEAMLQGQIAGVTVQANGGDPTTPPNVIIRGQGSPNGDKVLWVVDGVPGAPIPSMYDIETIAVLKDAASAAIYGAQSGAGGVVLVTTKKAKAGAPSVTYEGVFGARTATNVPHALSAAQQIEVAKKSFGNAGLDLPQGWNPELNPNVAVQRTDWMDEIFRTAFYQRHNVVVNTGNDMARHRLSYSYDDDQGTLLNTFNKKHTFHYNGIVDINKWVRITEDFTWRNTAARSTNTTSPESGVIINAIHMPSSAAVYNEDGTYGGITVDGKYPDIHGDAINPIRLLKGDNQYNSTNNAWSTTSLELHDIVPGLKFVSRFSYFYENNYYKNFSPRRPEQGKPRDFNMLDVSAYRYSKWLTENTLTYDKTFKNVHTLGLLLSTTADKQSGRSLLVEAKGLSDESNPLQYLSYASTANATDALYDVDSNVAIIARAAYSYADRYFVTASWRRDYAGRLDPANNHGDFPAVTGGWKISSEPWFPKTDNLSLLKLRGSWGRVGNIESVPYCYKTGTLANVSWSEQAQYGVGGNTLWGNMTYFKTAVNSELTWETSEQWDLGLDFGAFRNRLNFSVDYFNKRTFNLIQYQSVNWPATMGVDPMLVNLGEVRNQGVEVELGWNDHVGDWSYFVNANFAYLHNEVTEIGSTDADGQPGVWMGDVYGNTEFKQLTNLYQTTQGQALNTFWLIKSHGVIKDEATLALARKAQPNAQLGDLYFEDFNGDGSIDDKDRQYCGSASPKTTFNLSAGFTWKNLTLSAQFQGVGGAHALFVGKTLTLDDTENNFNRWDKILDAWSPENAGSDIPRISKSDANGNFNTSSTYYLENSSYLRLKNLTIGYDLTSQLRRASHFASRASSLYIYLSGENLFTITNYSGMDPECGGFDTMKYPLSRVFSFGVKLTY